MSGATVLAHSHLSFHLSKGVSLAHRRSLHHMTSSLTNASVRQNHTLRICASRASSWRKTPRLTGSTTTTRRSASAQSTSRASALLSESLDTKPRGQSNNHQETAGPFTLGVSSQQMQSGPAPKKWATLTPGEKVVRSAKQTTNFGVILFGAGLFALLTYTLTSELFSTSSPTVVYGKACDKINKNAQVAKYLNGPFTFHNNAPSLNRPRHRNRQIPSQLAVDSHGHEHLYLHFYLEGRTEAHSSQRDDLPWPERAEEWMIERLGNVKELDLETSTRWAKERAQALWDSTRSILRFISGSPAPSPPSVPAARPAERSTSIGRPEEQGGWSFAGIFGGLRKNLKGGGGGTGSETMPPDGARWVDGEVHADLVKDASGQFIWRYLVVDIPNSNVRNPLRVYVERSPSFREGESLVSWTSS